MPIEIIGIEEIKARLDRLSNEKTKLAIQRAGARKAAKVLLAAQQQTVPFDTGRLEGTLGIQTKKVGSIGVVTAIGPDKKLNFIGRFHEFGTKFMAGKHWMQKAFDSSKDEALEAYTSEVTKLLDKHEYDDLMAAIEAAANLGDEE
jgi:HK97 gp10 family phage protein